MTVRDFSLAFRLAARELRSGKRRFTVFLSCLILGVFAIAAVGSVSESARSAISRDARILLGGDASIQLTATYPASDERAWLEQHGTLSHSISLRGMARTTGALSGNTLGNIPALPSDDTVTPRSTSRIDKTPVTPPAEPPVAPTGTPTGTPAAPPTDTHGNTAGSTWGGTSALVAVKGVDATYPLYGQVRLSPDIPLHKALAEVVMPDSGATKSAPPIMQAEQSSGTPQQTYPAPRPGKPVYGAAVDSLLLERLKIQLGDTLIIGDQSLRVTAILDKEPDRAFQGVTFGPRVLMSLQALEGTGLLIPGSLIHSQVRIRIPAGNRAASENEVTAFTDAARTTFPDKGWRIEPFTKAAPRIRTFLDRMDTDLLLIGLGTLLVGGLGIAEAVRGYLSSRMQNIATLKCVGGGVATVLWTYFFQIAIIGGFGIIVGCACGALVPWLGREALGQLLPVLPDASLHWMPLLRAALLGCAIILAFSLRPLLLAGGVSPAVLFRGYASTQRNRLSISGKAMVITSFAMLTGLVFLFTPDTRLALGFCGVVIGCLVIFRGVSWGMQTLSRRISYTGHPSIRLGISSIHRPGAPTVNLVFALGLGLTALVAIAQVEQNLTNALERDLSRDAPAFFFINILPDQLKDFETLAHAPGVTRMEQGPMVRGRIIRIKGIPVEDAPVGPDAQWAVRGDRGLSHAASMPEDTEIVAGTWWPKQYSGPPLISLTDDLAKGFGVGIGDTLMFNILGREVTATIANIRKVDWMTFQLQFAILFAPGLLDAAPVTWIATTYGSGEGMDALYRTVTTSYPNVTAFSMREILSDVQNMMRRMGAVFSAMAAVMLVTGLLVLAGAVLADRHRRIYDAVIYKVCGATSSDILLALITEFTITGIATGIFSALTGTAAAWAAVEGLLHQTFTVQPVSLLVTILSATGFSLLFGLAGTYHALNKKPAPYLRNE